MRFYGTRFDDFTMLYHYFSSIRSVLEYFAPAVFTSQILLVNRFSNRIAITDDSGNPLNLDANGIVVEKIWNILLVYYLLEFVSDAFCWAINKRLSYNRISIIGNLKWVTLFLMILYVGTLVDLPALISGFLKVSPTP